MTALLSDSLLTPRFCGLPTFMRLPLRDDLSGLDAAIVGIPSDSGAPYRSGARFAPNAVRSMSVMLRPINPSRNNINVFETLNVADVGDSPVVPGYEVESLALIEETIHHIAAAGVVPCAIGGDHSVTLAELRALARVHGPLALVQFDSHSDTWDKYFADQRYSAGTPFRRAVEENIVDPHHSIQIGLRGSLFRTTDITQSIDLGYKVLTTDALFQCGISAVARQIAEHTAGRPVFITFDMDFVDPAFAPAVETPEAGGPSSREALQLLRELKDINLVGCDVTEISPAYDGPGQITSLLGATVMLELLSLLASYRSTPRT
ncbi:agmatinase [Erwinia endophytica]|uniref:agmatinase n=1 Tax=Erwinia endophytica TaxID=1563158 RepID=UPI001265E70A|nr:agmatinase [Erwinia endophytica]KAB8306214.1 agmatinase [Erwinia endophytica]